MLTLEKTKNTIQMLQSEDKENHVVAFGILENLDMEANIASILYCIKYYRGSAKVLEENAPEIYKYLMKKWDGIEITLKMVFDAITEMKPDIGQLQVYFNIMEDSLMEQCKTAGYTEVSSIKITVK